MRIALAIFVTTSLGLLLAAGPTAVPDSPSNLPNWPPPQVAPLLSAEDAIRTMKLPPGFHMQVVASEPMIEHPVVLNFDEDGRAWVVEMRSYMPNVEGSGENKPTGRISILEDTDGDGRMDKVTRFMDDLVLPRAVLPVRGGALVAVPPKLLFCRDTDGDGKADVQTVVATDYGVGGNPEHQPNGLMTDLDNWIYSANYDKRLRFIAGSWMSDVIPELGQWGITQDDYGRLFHDTNTDQLRGSLIAPHYANRSPHYRGAGADEQIAASQAVFPAHPTAVDRGYLHAIMRDDGTLRNFTAACAPVIYRGGVFPADFSGNAFVCEPAANLVKRDILTDAGGTITARDAYDHAEFLTSTYERFRPVYASVGPDGALYLVDMHHGLIQHKTYLTTYCKDQYLARDLEKYMGTGRIYRIVPDADLAGAKKLFPRPHLSTATTQELVNTLHHPNGWWRDTAQRLLVERGDYHAIPLLRQMAAGDADPIARLHALWTLEGFRINDPKVIGPALSDPNPRIRAAAARLAEPLLSSPLSAAVLPKFMRLAEDPDPTVRLQFALSASGLATEQTDAALASVLSADASNRFIRDAVITGTRGRELAFLQRLLSLPGWETDLPGRAAMLTGLAKAIAAEASPRRVAQLLQITAEQPPTALWRQIALLDGLQPPGGRARNRKAIMLEGEPTSFLALKSSAAAADAAEKVQKVLSVVHWPGEPGYVPPPPPRPLSAAEQARFEHGRQVYTAVCAACHKSNGLGQEGLAPPLVDSEWVLGPPARLTRIVLHGIQGPVTVGDRTYNMEMPGLQKMPNDDIAAVLTFIRRSWDHGAAPIAPPAVARARATTRPVPWTERELLKLR